MKSLIFLEVLPFCDSEEGIKLFAFLGEIFDIIKILIPVILVVLGIIDLTKAIISSKPEQMSKSTQMFIKRLISGVCIYFIVPIVSLVLDLANVDINNSCFNTFISKNNTVKENKDNIVEEKNIANNITDVKCIEQLGDESAYFDSISGECIRKNID